MLIQTEHGNVLWDLVALLDEQTINFVRPWDTRNSAR